MDRRELDRDCQTLPDDRIYRSCSDNPCRMDAIRFKKTQGEVK